MGGEFTDSLWLVHLKYIVILKIFIVALVSNLLRWLKDVHDEVCDRQAKLEKMFYDI